MTRKGKKSQRGKKKARFCTNPSTRYLLRLLDEEGGKPRKF